MYQQHKNLDNTVCNTGIKRIADNAFIPFDPDNSDYIAFLKYQAEGGKVYGADEEVPDGQANQ